jgi:hypothetical protein
LWLYGTEAGLTSSPENFARDQELAQKDGRRPDARSFIRQPIGLAAYQKLLNNPLAQKTGEILKLRLEKLPDRYDVWQAQAEGGRVLIKFSGIKNRQQLSGQVIVNLKPPYDWAIKFNPS